MYAHNTQFVCFQCEAKKLTRFLGLAPSYVNNVARPHFLTDIIG